MRSKQNNEDFEEGQKIYTNVQPEEGVETNHSKILALCAVRGGISAKQAERLTDLSYRVCYSVLKELSGGSNRTSPALREVHVSLVGKMGRPQAFYLLTKPGAFAVSQLLSGKKVIAPELHGAVEISHAFIEMEIFSLAQEKKFPFCAVEEVIYFEDGNANIRADVVVELSASLQIIEIEQEADRASIPRIIAKLVRMIQFYQSAESAPYTQEIWFLFNIDPADSKTLDIWKEALQAASMKCDPKSIPAIRWTLLLDFQEFRSTKMQTLEAEQVQHSVQKISANANELSAEMITSSLDIYGSSVLEMQTVLEALAFTSKAYFDGYLKYANFRSHAKDFMELMRYIYLASNHKQSDSSMYGVPPHESIFLLKRYLCAHQNQALLEELKECLLWIRKRQTGVTNYRNAMTSMIWDVFMRFHGFSRGSAIRINFMAPSFEDSRSDYWVDVVFLSNELKAMTHIGSHYKSEEAEALAWVLEALYTYTEELGLGKRLWRIKAQSKRRKS